MPVPGSERTGKSDGAGCARVNDMRRARLDWKLTAFRATWALVCCLGAGAWAARAPVASACDCAAAPTGLDEAEAAFTGVADRTLEEPDPQEGYLTAFHVLDSWKGVSDPVVGVRAWRASRSCGIPFRAGQAYFVYAVRSPQGQLTTNTCLGTQRLEEAQASIQALGPSHRWRTADEQLAAEYVTIVPPGPSQVIDPHADPVKRSIQLLELRRAFYARYHGERVLIEAPVESAFEHQAIAGLWVVLPSEIAQVLYESVEYQAAKQRLTNDNPERLIQVPVRFWGVLEAEPGRGYGHLGQYPGQLTVERMTLLPDAAAGGLPDLGMTE